MFRPDVSLLTVAVEDGRNAGKTTAKADSNSGKKVNK